jgi:hypothetical protein
LRGGGARHQQGEHHEEDPPSDHDPSALRVYHGAVLGAIVEARHALHVIARYLAEGGEVLVDGRQLASQANELGATCATCLPVSRLTANA